MCRTSQTTAERIVCFTLYCELLFAVDVFHMFRTFHWNIFFIRTDSQRSHNNTAYRWVGRSESEWLGEWHNTNTHGHCTTNCGRRGGDTEVDSNLHVIHAGFTFCPPVLLYYYYVACVNTFPFRRLLGGKWWMNPEGEVMVTCKGRIRKATREVHISDYYGILI